MRFMINRKLVSIVQVKFSRVLLKRRGPSAVVVNAEILKHGRDVDWYSQRTNEIHGIVHGDVTLNKE